ncbi:hypothetical protein EYY60_15140 [Flavobacterium zhairuonense]|uniref:hypothetical protein n=1 Tax=Flavobacterium zhairuonense TaxID=2493631 RepID=UPI001043600C|nr:hypothetical protein [Flavobacterium zhairuonense]KAF2508463.1 hypothetical protein EYY60_15140 [Flavobacterium zhairuonense]
MKKIILLAVIVVASFSCAKKVSPEKSESQEPKSETKKETVVGADSDVHGCKASAGYTWSTLKKECIRVFEGTKLSHYDDGKEYTTASYVIFDGNKAELFLDTQKESIILERKSEGDSWKKDDLELIPWKGYVLKKGGKILYTGQ